MCAHFEILPTELPKIKEVFPNIKYDKNIDWKSHVFPGYDAPTILKKEGEIILNLMRFSLIPHWSKSEKLKFSTHNARVETIQGKPAWKQSLQARRCLVPMQTFFEAINFEIKNDFSGHVVGFKLNKILFAAGIYDEWKNKETGEIINSFAVITSSASEEIAKIGHDRSPLFLDNNYFLSWVDDKPISFKNAFDILSHSVVPNFIPEKIRPLKNAKVAI